MVRVARRAAEEPDAYDEEVQKVIGIFEPHLGSSRVHETHTIQWRIVSKAVDVESLTLKSASGAPRSPANNWGLVDSKGATNTQDSEPVEGVAVLEHPPETPIDWDDMTVTRSVMSRIRAIPSQIKKPQRSFDPYSVPDVVPSARLTSVERARTSRIYSELALQNITPERWELEALARGAKVKFGDISMQYAPVND